MQLKFLKKKSCRKKHVIICIFTVVDFFFSIADFIFVFLNIQFLWPIVVCIVYYYTMLLSSFGFMYFFFFSFSWQSAVCISYEHTDEQTHARYKPCK